MAIHLTEPEKKEALKKIEGLRELVFDYLPDEEQEECMSSPVSCMQIPADFFEKEMPEE